MELRSLQCPSLSSIVCPVTSRHSLSDKPSVGFQVLKLPNSKKYPHARKCRHYGFRAQAAGTAKFSSAAVEATEEKASLKNENLVFVAGATGKVGSRTVRELLKFGFQVRAGVRSAQRAQTLVKSVREMKLNSEDKSQAVEKLEIIECDLEKQDQIVPALGNASVVICCIGASEKEVFDITGPYRIDYMATKNLIDAATTAKVKHFIMVSSLGTNKFGWPAAILNLFWGVLFWKRKAEEALIASGLPYTIVRPGGMERPTDAFKETHNITLSQEDTLFGGLVSNLQVAELMAVMVKNLELSYCKVVEVVAETTAPLTPMEELLAKIPSKRPLPKVPKSSGLGDLKASESKLSTAPSTPSEKYPDADPKPIEIRPLSPYTNYDGLKPPTSPTPTPPGGRNEEVTVDIASEPELEPEPEPAPEPPEPELKPEPEASVTETISETKEAASEFKTRPLSPYAVYEDLKPPSSPSPTPSGPRDSPTSASTLIGPASPSISSNDASKAVDSEVIEETPPQKLDSSRSPYYVYEDLKPPTSPSPNAPNGALPKSSSSNGAAQATLSDNSAAQSSTEEESNSTAQSPTEEESSDKMEEPPKPRPLSPYTMYEDLKPPSTPSPSPPKFS